MLKLSKNQKTALLSILFFSLPFQIQSFIYEADAGFGLINSYARIYLSIQLLLIFLIFFTFSLSGEFKKKEIPLGILMPLTLVVLSFLFSPAPDFIFQALLLIQVFTLGIFVFVLLKSKTVDEKVIWFSFIASMCFQAALSLLQWGLQGDLGLHFLGEPHLSLEVANLAKWNFLGETWIRSYGTFPHPNILAAFLLLSILLTLRLRFELKPYFYPIFFLQMAGFLTTFSRLGFIALLIGLLFSIENIKKLDWKRASWIFLILPLFLLLVLRFNTSFTDGSLEERWLGIEHSLVMLKEYPLGVGFQHYTLMLNEITEINLAPWQYQPVHNSFLLFLSEFGIIVSIFFLILFIFFVERKVYLKKGFYAFFLPFLILALNDHFFLTLEQGRILMTLFLYWAIVESKKSAAPKQTDLHEPSFFPPSAVAKLRSRPPKSQ